MAKRELARRTRQDRIPIEIIRKELEQRDTLGNRIIKRRRTWFSHVERMDDKRLPRKALYVEGTRSRGRQTRTWMDNVRQDLAQKNMDMRTA